MFKRIPLNFSIVLVILLITDIGTNLAQNSKEEKFYRGTPINPIIETMINSVSADTILSYLETLVSFQTRHTNSDTTSANFGIGAARNYIFNKFTQYETQSNGGITPSFFVFPATVCGTFNGAHKNVMATITGTQTSDRVFISSGHMDSRTTNVCDNTSFAPSANDDGSGTVVSMEAARILSQFSDEMESTLILMTVTGEDQGLFGSTAYADWAFENNLRIDAMVTNDVVGNITGCIDPSCSNGEFITDSTSVRHFSGGPSTSSSRQFTRYMKLKAEQYVIDVPWTVNLIPAIDRPGRGGDHMPFYDNGYAAARFTEAHEFGDGSGDNGHQHNEFDLIEFMNIQYVARIVKTNIAGFASLAMAPETPSAPLDVLNVGNGTDVILTWAGTNTEPDFDGYRIAVRHADSLFYQQIVPVGNVTQYTLTGLTPDEPIYISYSAIDTDGNESIFSPEVLITPSDIPATPQGTDITSMVNGIELTWLPNTELDLDGYRITREGPVPPLVEFDVDTSTTAYVDNTAQPHLLYHYTVQARDVDNNLSPSTESMRGQLATHDLGVLILDFSRDGTGVNQLFPSDEQVDDFYDNILSGFNVAAQWDVADSLEINLNISDADMGIYSVVVVHSDVRNATDPIAQDTVALRKYLQNGGHLFFSGWQLIKNVSEHIFATKVFVPGDFVYDYLQIDTSENAATNDFRGGDPVAANYPSVTVDSVKLPNFGGDLISMEVFQSIVGSPDTEVLYTYRSSSEPPSEFHGVPVALKHISNEFELVAIDFPLYYLFEDQAKMLIEQGLNDLGEVTGIDDEPERIVEIPTDYDLEQNYPNPFNPSTNIKYSLPFKSDVLLSVYNTIGEEVAVLVSEQQDAGSYVVKFDAKYLSSGIYFYKIKAGNFIKVKKMILLK